MNSDSLSSLERTVGDLVQSSGASLLKFWQSEKDVRYKEAADPVTDFDIRLEHKLRQALGKLMPEAGFIVEEGETHQADTYNWVIDPIDQTKNFVGQIPLFYSQVCLLEYGIPVLAALYNPVSEQLMTASKGNGVRLNQMPYRRSPKARLRDAIVDVDFGGDSQSLAWRIGVLGELSVSAFRVRMTGGSYAPYIVTGGIDLFIVINEKTKLVDQLPRMILVRESGLVFEEHTVNGHPILLAGPKDITSEALDVLKRCEQLANME